jgi:tetratricopeptide (TPR) repeat protein
MGCHSERSEESRCAAAQTLLDRLQDAALLVRSGVDGRSRYTMLHPTRAYAAQKLNGHPSARAIRQRFIAFFRQLVMDNDDINDHAKLAVLTAEWRNAVAAAETAEGLTEWEAVAYISAYLGDFLLLRGLWSERERLDLRALAAARAAGNRQNEGGALNNLGVVYDAQGRWAEAEASYQDSLKIRREFGDRVGEGKTLGNLALLREAQGDIAGALTFARQAVAVLERTEDKAELEKARGLVAKWERTGQGGGWLGRIFRRRG